MPKPEPTSGKLKPWAWTWPPPWWPSKPLLKGLHGSVKVEAEDMAKSLGPKEAVQQVRASQRMLGFDDEGAPLQFKSSPDGEHSYLKVAMPRAKLVGVGPEERKQKRTMLSRPLRTESDFPQPSTTTVAYM